MRVSLVNKRVKFECKAEGTDPLSYRWLKDGKPLIGRKYKADLCKLKIKNLLESDAGIYTCVASNVYGNSLCSYKLFVVSKYEISLLSDVLAHDLNLSSILVYQKLSQQI